MMVRIDGVVIQTFTNDSSAYSFEQKPNILAPNLRTHNLTTIYKQR